MFLCLDSLPVRAVIRHCAWMSVCLSACLAACVLYIYFFFNCLSGIPRCFEGQLLSFTVKHLAYWKGHFSNGATLPLIFCLSLGARLIYHASYPADIQIHFDWRLDGTTRATSSAVAALAPMRKHKQSNVMLCFLSEGMRWI